MTPDPWKSPTRRWLWGLVRRYTGEYYDDHLRLTRRPWWLGYAWEGWEEYTRTYAAIPLNIVLQLGRNLWIWMVTFRRPDVVARAYQAGKTAGDTAGYQRAWREMLRMLPGIIAEAVDAVGGVKDKGP